MKLLGFVTAALLALAPLAAQAADPALSAPANAAFLANNAKQAGWIVRPSGLQYKIIQNGFGKHPKPTDHVSVYYTGKLINGKVFDGTEAGMPANFKTNELIPGWTEALEIMREGDHWQIVIPSVLAYGSRGTPDGTIPPNQTLVFDLQLLSVLAPTKEEQQQEQEEQQQDQDSHPGPGAE
jgi:FKBP-type peptidyl-prolyl cis-trans isomerase